MKRKSASLFAISFVAGIVGYSLKDIVHNLVPGSAWFLGSFALVFTLSYLYFAWAASQANIRAELRHLRELGESGREAVTDGRK